MKLLLIEPGKCTGCRLCEMVCSVKKTGASNPARARIHVIKWEMEAVEMPMTCQQCQTPSCQAVCPAGAIYRDEAFNRVSVNYDKCIGCKMCISACPFGAIGFDSIERRVIKCDLCDGNPICVEFCQTGALQLVDAEVVNLKKKRIAALSFSELVKKFT